MRFVVVGSSIHSTSIDVREHLAFAPKERETAIVKLFALPEIHEAMLLSTCNRVEIYAVGHEAASVERACIRFLAESRSISEEELRGSIFRKTDADALTHIFRVTASLDALVVGEAQIMGQVKDAFAEARAATAIGPLLGRCLERAFHVAKVVRTETAIARQPASVSSVAVDLAGRIFADLSAVAVLVVGAGEMAELAGRHLLSHGTRRLRVANRSPERGVKLARLLDGEPVPFDSLGEQLLWADVVVSSTGSPTPILGKKLLANVLKRRKQRPLLIVDIAVPRDVDPAARRLDNLYLFDVDALTQVVGKNLARRKEEAKTAEKMVAKEVKAFEKWLRSQGAVPVVKKLRQQFSTIARAEAEKTVKKLKLEGKEAKTLQRLADAIVNKLLHAATIELKTEEGDALEHARLADATRRLFHLDATQEETPERDVSKDREVSSASGASPTGTRQEATRQEATRQEATRQGEVS